jgi:seryl-tRNA synthetase
MLDIKLIRERPDWVKDEIAKLNSDAPIDQIVELDERRRALLSQVEELKAERNRVSKSMGPLRGKIKKASGDEKATLEAEFDAVREEMGEVGNRIKTLDDQVREIDEALDEAILLVPNLPDPSVPVGPDEEHNVVVRQEGNLPKFDFEPLPHWDLGPMLGILDF